MPYCEAREEGLAFLHIGTIGANIEKMYGAPFDTEKNWAPGAGVSLSLMRNWFVENLYFNARFAWENGKTNYVGAYQGHPFGSLVSTSGATVFDYDLRLGKGFTLQPSFRRPRFYAADFMNGTEW